MLPRLTLDKRRKNLVCRGVLGRGIGYLVLAIDGTPALRQYLLARSLEFHLVHLSHDRGCRELAIGIKHGYEAPGYQVVNFLLHVGQSCGHLPRGNDGMVIGHL